MDFLIDVKQKEKLLYANNFMNFQREIAKMIKQLK